MKEKTSLIHKTALKKNITRYWPIWGIYGIFMLLVLFGMTEYDPASMADDMLMSLPGMAWINTLYAGVCAAFLFMDLFKGRLCNALHAFPMRRESWLATHILSGLLFSFVPNLLVSLLAGLILWEYAYIVPIWLAVVTLQYLFFFGSAVLCAVCAGNLIGMAGLYAIFHLITVLMGGIAELFYQPLLHGVELGIDSFFRFIPLGMMNNFQYAEFEVSHITAVAQGTFYGLVGESWLYVGLCAVAGAACMVLAWRVYRKRQLESAGDLLSLKKLSPLFLLICTVGAGAVLYLFSNAFGGDYYVFLAVGAVVGYFAGQMLLKRTVKVFTKRAFLGFGIIVAVAAGSMLLTWLDPLGVTRYVPELDKIESAAVIGADKGYYFYPTDSSMISYTDTEKLDIRFKITDESELAALQDFHKELIQYRPDSDTEQWRLADVTVRYTLKSGRVISRYYHVEPDSEAGKLAKGYYNDIRYIFGVNDSRILYELFDTVTFEGRVGDRAYQNIKLSSRNEISGLLNAIQKDCQAGNMAQNWAFHDDSQQIFYLTFSIENENLQDAMGRSNIRLQVYADSAYTTAYLQQILAKRSEN